MLMKTWKSIALKDGPKKHFLSYPNVILSLQWLPWLCILSVCEKRELGTSAINWLINILTKKKCSAIDIRNWVSHKTVTLFLTQSYDASMPRLTALKVSLLSVVSSFSFGSSPISPETQVVFWINRTNILSSISSVMICISLVHSCCLHSWNNAWLWGGYLVNWRFLFRAEIHRKASSGKGAENNKGCSMGVCGFFIICVREMKMCLGIHWGIWWYSSYYRWSPCWVDFILSQNNWHRASLYLRHLIELKW